MTVKKKYVSCVHNFVVSAILLMKCAFGPDNLVILNLSEELVFEYKNKSFCFSSVRFVRKWQEIELCG